MSEKKEKTPNNFKNLFWVVISGFVVISGYFLFFQDNGIKRIVNQQNKIIQELSTKDSINNYLIDSLNQRIKSNQGVIQEKEIEIKEFQEKIKDLSVKQKEKRKEIKNLSPNKSVEFFQDYVETFQKNNQE